MGDGSPAQSAKAAPIGRPSLRQRPGPTSRLAALRCLETFVDELRKELQDSLVEKFLRGVTLTTDYSEVGQAEHAYQRLAAWVASFPGSRHGQSLQRGAPLAPQSVRRHFGVSLVLSSRSLAGNPSGLLFGSIPVVATYAEAWHHAPLNQTTLNVSPGGSESLLLRHLHLVSY